MLDLGGEDVHPTHHQHVVGPPPHLLHTHHGAPALALFGVQHRPVPGSVADQRQPLFGEGGEDQFAGCVVAQRLPGMGVNDLRYEMVLGNVHTTVIGTLHRDARANDLRQAVDVVGLYAQFLLDLLPHLGSPGLGTQDTNPQLEVLNINPHLLGRLC